MKIDLMMTAEAKNKLVTIPYTGTQGLYASVLPDAGATFHIMEIAKELGTDTLRDKLHVTVIYSKKAIPDPFKEVVTNYYEGYITHVDSWVGHNGKTCVVLKLASMELIQQFAAFQKAGAEHTFIPYSPHFTLSSDFEVDDALKEKMKVINARLAADPVRIKMIDLTISDLDDD